MIKLTNGPFCANEVLNEERTLRKLLTLVTGGKGTRETKLDRLLPEEQRK